MLLYSSEVLSSVGERSALEGNDYTEEGWGMEDGEWPLTCQNVKHYW